jgi:hypothetical protein
MKHYATINPAMTLQDIELEHAESLPSGTLRVSQDPGLRDALLTKGHLRWRSGVIRERCKS